jgi:hypothetical protein
MYTEAVEDLEILKVKYETSKKSENEAILKVGDLEARLASIEGVHE